MAEPLSPEQWYQWPDGTKTCWWCAASVHPQVADIHHAWHVRLEGDDPIALRPAPGEPVAEFVPDPRICP